MKNIMEINGYKAVIQFDPEIEMFRGEFVGLHGGADFYAADVDSLKREGAASLRVYLDMCREDGVEPERPFSGNLNLRLSAGAACRNRRRSRSRGQEHQSMD